MSKSRLHIPNPFSKPNQKGVFQRAQKGNLTKKDIDWIKKHPEDRNEEGDTPLHVAVRANQAANVRSMLEAKISPNPTDIYNSTPLHLACCYDNRTIITLLLEAGADVNAQNQWGRTPLFSAAINLSRDAIALLLNDPNINVNIRDKRNQNALEYALHDMSDGRINREKWDDYCNIIQLLSERGLVCYDIVANRHFTFAHFDAKDTLYTHSVMRSALNFLMAAPRMLMDGLKTTDGYFFPVEIVFNIWSRLIPSHVTQYLSSGSKSSQSTNLLEAAMSDALRTKMKQEEKSLICQYAQLLETHSKAELDILRKLQEYPKVKNESQEYPQSSSISLSPLTKTSAERCL